MADSFNKKEREKKRRKRKQDKRELKKQRKESGKKPAEFMYVDFNGNLTTTPPETPRRKIKLEEIEISTPKQDESSAPNYERSGRVKFFNHEKGYGFIIDGDTGESYFVHINDLQVELEGNDEVIFEIGSGPKGPVATNVRKGGATKPADTTGEEE